MNRLLPVLALVLCLVARSGTAQQGVPPQDPVLDNLVHDAGYATAAEGSLGAVVERGSGAIDMVLVSGFGNGASAFEGFMARNRERYRMVAITLPGFEGSAAPPMPPAGTSYGEQTWTLASAAAVAQMIRTRGLRRPVLVGHFLNGTQVAARVAVEHPNLVRALVLLAGTPRFEPPELTPQWPRGMSLAKKVELVDRYLAPRWFKNVTRDTWVAGNYQAPDYSVDPARGSHFADLANAPPLPVLVRWLCEFHASDVRPELEQSKVPVLLLQPGFTAALRADPKRQYLASFFAEPWRGLTESRAGVEMVAIPDACILLMEDKPNEVDRAVAEFLARGDGGGQGATTDSLREVVRGAIAWIATQAVPLRGADGAVSFPGREGGKLTATNVYGGSAGVAIFLENAAAVLGDRTARELADRTIAGLRAARRVDSQDRVSWTKGSMMGVTGLYTGDAGVGQAFLVRHALRGDADALATAAEVGDALLARARGDHGALSWGEQPDIVFGNAGTALFLLDLGLASKQARFLDAARRAGRGLLADAVYVPSQAEPTRQLPTWRLGMGGLQVHMPNFSHGTAGVAYALVRIGAETGDRELVQAGEDGARWLIEHAVEDGEGLKWAASDRGPAVYMGGWCHGPAGTGRLFLLLHAVTGDAKYLDVAKKGARFLADYAARTEQAGKPGERPYVPPSYCCGVAGVVDFFCDLSRVTGDAAHAAFANKAGGYLVDVAIADGDGRKWRNGQSVTGGPIAADSTACNVDLMLGAAGEAFALLRLATIQAAEDPTRGMPDRAVVTSAAPGFAKEKPTMSDQLQLQGTWQLVAGTVDGKVLADDAAQSCRLTIRGDRLVTTNGDRVTVDGKIRLDPSKLPKKLDLDLGDNIGRGIYELHGDDLKLVHGEDGGDRPTRFESKPGSKSILMILKRVKD